MTAFAGLRSRRDLMPVDGLKPAGTETAVAPIFRGMAADDVAGGPLSDRHAHRR